MVQNLVKPLKSDLITYFNIVPPPPPVVTFFFFFFTNLVFWFFLNEGGSNKSYFSLKKTKFLWFKIL